MEIESLQKYLYWAPGIQWEIREKTLVIASVRFPEDYSQLFPDFYYKACRGLREEMVTEEFPDFSTIRLRRFIAKLKKYQILTDHIQSVDELFYMQSRLFQPAERFPEDYFQNSENVEKYRLHQIRRQITLPSDTFCIQVRGELPAPEFSERTSCRRFQKNRKVGEEQFGGLFRVLSQFPGESTPRYCYPSAGGLYPIDIYCFIKENRVEGVKGGLYYFYPVQAQLLWMDEGNDIDPSLHFFPNRVIFESSAFSVFLVYNASVSMPKYGDRAYYYGMIDAGIILGYLNLAATRLGLGCCCIGEMKNDRIERALKLNEFQRYLQCIEFGFPDVHT
ncbi:MAG: SagB/ThcOx family dehydrogenase [Lachnospiraceae bacterium]|nr:SagB/ThcOx family dehydrogenase [Lachnospiraceae bacterium]